MNVGLFVELQLPSRKATSSETGLWPSPFAVISSRYSPARGWRAGNRSCVCEPSAGAVTGRSAIFCPLLIQQLRGHFGGRVARRVGVEAESAGARCGGTRAPRSGAGGVGGERLELAGVARELDRGVLRITSGAGQVGHRPGRDRRCRACRCRRLRSSAAARACRAALRNATLRRRCRGAASGAARAPRPRSARCRRDARRSRSTRDAARLVALATPGVGGSGSHTKRDARLARPAPRRCRPTCGCIAGWSIGASDASALVTRRPARASAAATARLTSSAVSAPSSPCARAPARPAASRAP